MKQPVKSNWNIFPVFFTATRFESRIIFKSACYIRKFGSSCGIALHSDAGFVLNENKYMFNKNNTCIKVNHKIIIRPTFVHISWRRRHNCANTLVLIFVIYSMRKVPRCSSFMSHLLTYQIPWKSPCLQILFVWEISFSSTKH